MVGRASSLTRNGLRQRRPSLQLSVFSPTTKTRSGGPQVHSRRRAAIASGRSATATTNPSRHRNPGRLRRRRSRDSKARSSFNIEAQLSTSRSGVSPLLSSRDRDLKIGTIVSWPRKKKVAPANRAAAKPASRKKSNQAQRSRWVGRSFTSVFK